MEVLNLHYLASSLVVLNEGVDLLLLVGVLDEQFLDPVVVQQVFLPHPEDFKGLDFSHEPALDAQSLLRHLLPVLV